LGYVLRAAAPLLARGVTLLLAAGALEPQQFRTGTETVPLYVTVTDRERRLVPIW
jgi:hypothetical protein